MPKRECNLRTELGSDCSWQRHYYTSFGLDKAQSLQLRAAIQSLQRSNWCYHWRNWETLVEKVQLKVENTISSCLVSKVFLSPPLASHAHRREFRCLDEARPPTDMLPHREPPPIHIQFLINGWLLPPWKISQEPGTLPKAQGENLWNHWNRAGSWEHSNSASPIK